MIKRLFFVFFSLACILYSCAKEEVDPLPDAPVVNYYYYLPASAIESGNPDKIRGYGYKSNGLLLVPEIFSGDGYKAYDATCTRNIKEETTSLTLSQANFTATCSKCKTVYDLRTGMDTGGSIYLKKYRAFQSDTYHIHIVN